MKIPFVIITIFSGLVTVANPTHHHDPMSGKFTDTIYAGTTLPNTKFLKNTHTRYILLLDNHKNYTSKILDRSINLANGQLTIVQKLNDNGHINTDSVVTEATTLKPLSSFSDIQTSKDSFVYKDNRVTGMMFLKNDKANSKTVKIDTTLSHSFFNGLIYAETFQSLSYKLNQPFYLAEYVPGHSTKITKITYIGDEELTISGTKIPVKIIESQAGTLRIDYYLSNKDQELIKIKAKFPAFDYQMIQLLWVDPDSKKSPHL